jgi:hypothetical protein
VLCETIGSSPRNSASFNDPTIKNSQQFKVKLALNRWLFFYGWIVKTRQVTMAAVKESMVPLETRAIKKRDVLAANTDALMLPPRD